MNTFALPRFYPILDTGALETRQIPVMDAFRALLDAGAGIVQFRHKRDWPREIFELAAQLSAACRDRNVAFIVNDRADAALAVGAAGVHLGQADLTPSAVRTFAGTSLMIGYSTHNEAQLRAAAAEPADYLALGPIFDTSSKERPDPVVGIDELARLRRLSPRPLVAIGGVTRDNAAEAWAAGADSCAVIADMLRDDWRASIEAWARLAQREGGT